MIFVPVGYVSEHSKNMKEIHGGSPYGSGTFGIDNHPSEIEKKKWQKIKENILVELFSNIGKAPNK